MTKMSIKKIAKKIGDREAAIEIGIADHFLNGDRDRDRDLNFGDRAHALQVTPSTKVLLRPF